MCFAKFALINGTVLITKLTQKIPYLRINKQKCGNCFSGTRLMQGVIEDFLHFWKFPTAMLQKVCRPAWGTNHLHTKNCRIYRSNPNLGATKLQLFCNNKQLYVLPWGKIIFPTKYIQNKIWLPRHTIGYLLTKSQWSWKPIWSHNWIFMFLQSQIIF